MMECEVEKIGILRNHVISWQDAYGVDPGPISENVYSETKKYID
ncbi:MAG: hypothetical protein U0Y68_26460 [Blastocatellia bacterium]